jgi:peptide/nickel transport system substrate-binding protein
MRKALVAAGVVAVALVLLSAASASGSRSSAIPLLRVAMGLGSSLDITKAGAGQVYVADLGLETLMTIAPDGSLKPWLARSVSRPSSTVYVYQLRHGVKFWDGNEMTAADVVYSLNYERKPGSWAGFGYASVKSITARGRYTVQVTLTHPDPNWAYSAAEYSCLVFEKSFQQAHKATFGQPGTLVMGTGPWKFDSLDPTSGAELSANPRWWGGKVNIEHLSIKFFGGATSENSEALAFRAGEIDAVGPGSIGNPKAFAATAKTKLLVTPSLWVVSFPMNTRAAPWSDVHVRRAVAYATDRAGIIRAVGGYATPIQTLILPVTLRTIGSQAQVNALLRSLPQYPFSLAKAKAEMTKSAYPHGFSYTLDVVQSVNLDTIGEALAGELQKIGIKLKVRVVSSAQWFTEISGPGDKRIATTLYQGFLSPDPSGLDTAFNSAGTKPGNFNVANYAVPAVDKLLLQGEAAVSPAKRRAIYQKVLTRFALDMPSVPIYSPQDALALSTKFSWPTVNLYSSYNGTWPLGIKPK